MHDAEFVATPRCPKTTGDHSTALQEDAAAYGLAPGDEGKIYGEGDQKILDAFHELQKLKAEGLIKNIGITGEPKFYCAMTQQLTQLTRVPFTYLTSSCTAHQAQSTL